MKQFNFRPLWCLIYGFQDDTGSRRRITRIIVKSRHGYMIMGDCILKFLPGADRVFCSFLVITVLNTRTYIVFCKDRNTAGYKSWITICLFYYVLQMCCLCIYHAHFCCQSFVGVDQGWPTVRLYVSILV